MKKGERKDWLKKKKLCILCLKYYFKANSMQHQKKVIKVSNLRMRGKANSGHTIFTIFLYD